MLELLRALRPHQWVKNGLVFVPVALTPERLGDLDAYASAFWAFLSLCAGASAGYLVNDLIDREADRVHPTKCQRPFARGVLSARVGLGAALLLFAIGLTLALLETPRAFVWHWLCYVTMTLVYSLRVKRWLIFDVMMLAGFYVLRVLAGGAATGITPTAWLVAFSLFLFLGLAFAKRYAELRLSVEAGISGATGRAYRAEDLGLVMTLGTISTYLSVLVLCLYINSDRVHGSYARVEWLWVLVPIWLYWVTRIWFVAARGHLSGDPVAFAVRDPASYLTGLAMVLVTAAATLGF